VTNKVPFSNNTRIEVTIHGENIMLSLTIKRLEFKNGLKTQLKNTVYFILITAY